MGAIGTAAACVEIADPEGGLPDMHRSTSIPPSPRENLDAANLGCLPSAYL